MLTWDTVTIRYRHGDMAILKWLGYDTGDMLIFFIGTGDMLIN